MTRLPHYRELKTLCGIRNQGQHQGVAPNPGELGRFIRAASNILSTCFQEAYGLSFTTFEPLHEIRNTDLRRLIRESQKALEEADILAAFVGTLYAFQKIVGALERSQLTSRERRLGRRASRPQFRVDTRVSDILQVVAQAERIITQIQEAASRELEAMREQVLIGRLGLSLYDTGKYRQLTGDMIINETGAGVRYVGGRGSGISELFLHTVDSTNHIICTAIIIDSLCCYIPTYGGSPAINV